MPVLLFTVDEVANSLVLRQRQLSKEILELADLKAKPLHPGESVAERHHKIAKRAKQLAEAFEAFDTIMRSTQKDSDDDLSDSKSDEPSAPNTSQAN